MQQALHIFQKDVRYLHREAGLLLALALVFPTLLSRHSFGLNYPLIFEVLIAMTAAYTIARLIHADAIPGSEQFWTTRPYRWHCLLSAKLLFIFAFINLPVFLVQVMVLRIDGFPIAANWPGLLWCQVLMIIAVELPLAALAALTRGIVAFIASALVLALLVIGLRALVDQNRFPDSFDWLRSSIALLAAALIAPPILYLQYCNRRTPMNRLWSLVAASLALAAYVLTPWPLLFAVQSRLSKASFDLQMAPASNAKIDLFSQRGGELYIVLPVRITGIPIGTRAQFENFVVTLEGQDGRTMRLSEGQLFTDYHDGESLGIRGSVPMEPFFLSARNQPVTLHAFFYITVFGNSHGEALVAPDAPRNISDGLQCYTDSINDLVFRSAFRLPAKSIDVKTNAQSANPRDRSITPPSHSVSYSPFPATLRINPIVVSEPYFLPPDSPVATIVIEEPLAHLRRDFEVRNVHIEER